MSMIGKTLGHYQIISQLGKGGMGEVYQAKDQKLGRDVAIKVLPEEFARDTDRVARFQREAKLLASLNHSNIAAIHGLEESGGTNFLVLELVEGETLADQIKSGPIPVEESLKLALQIAEALEAAHEKGVVHRDLKPANIKVTPDGKVKVLDFGLAKAFAGEQSELNLSNSPTLSNAVTQQGVILGTAAYMSPEQARGKAVDKRADIWAFGCVLFEMLTGQAAFQGDDITEILASVVKGGANLDLLPANIHPRVREILSHCLQKDLKKRYRDVGDLQFELEQLLADPSGVLLQPVTTVEPRMRLRQIHPCVAGAAVLALIIAGVAGWHLKPAPSPEPRPVSRFSLEAEGIGPNTGMALSHDGSRLVYAAIKNGVQQLFLRARDQMEAVPIGDTKDAMCPFFSPDGRWVGFFTETELKKVSISGGRAQTLCGTGYRLGASWGPDDTIVFASGDSPSLMEVSASGGEPKPLTKSEAGRGGHRWPEFLPDGKAVLFTIFQGTSNWQLAVLSLETKKHRVLINGTDGHFVSSGHLVFAREGSLWAVPFNRRRLELTGEAGPIIEGVQVNVGGWAQYALAEDGSLAYLPGDLQGVSTTLTWVDRKGKETPLAAPPNAYRDLRISPDGTRLALMVVTGGNSDIWIWDLVRETLTRLTFDPATDAYPLWATDGKRIVFASNREGGFKVYWKAADGTGKDEPIAMDSVPGKQGFPAAWSSDGKTLVLMGTGVTGASSSDIGALSMEGDHKYRPLLKGKYNRSQPQISPDGRWMAYSSNESGRYEIYVRPFPNVNKGEWQVSKSGGNNPLWSPNGRELFYRSSDFVMAASVETEPTFKPGRPTVLFRGTYAGIGWSSDTNFWDISPDGKRFLMMKEAVSTAKPAAAEPPRKINIVLNWLGELKQRVPVK